MVSVTGVARVDVVMIRADPIASKRVDDASADTSGDGDDTAVSNATA